MCGRFTLTVDPGELQDAFPGFVNTTTFKPRYNIAPTQPVAVIPNLKESSIDYYIWGLIPSWAKDPEIGSKLINARAETLSEKPSFRTAFRRRRCLVLADGFFEWKTIPGQQTKIPMFIHLKTGRVFAFAGLWEIWSPADGSEIRSCTIITTQPNQLLQNIHNRMPVILPPESYSAWLDPEERSPASLTNLLAPYPAEEMDAYPVSRLVNSPQNDVPECVQPA
jgi:putative SOS response-associated peptidase YedK